MAALPAPAAPKPPKPSSTPSSTVQRRSLPGPATFRGSSNLAPKPAFGPLHSSWAPSLDSSGPRPQPSLRASFLACLLPLVQFLPAHRMWFPLSTLCHLRKARFTLYLLMLSVVSRKGFSCHTCFNFVPVCGPGPSTDPS